ncbi:MAG: DUF2313 domain-containing protein [Gammaproteobacteria bacterium]|nr:DUF2313 domain-containing protein [Gammaproteobacteria bacterium]
MTNSVDHYHEQLQALLPVGPAWPREMNTVLSNLLFAIAEEFARVDFRVDNLLEEIDPRTASELLPDWETAFGLPDKCTDAAVTTVERRLALHEKVARVGGASPQYFIDVAARLGHVVTITENVPSAHHWQVNGPLDTIKSFESGGSTAGDPLRSWGNDVIECVISRIKPAHTIVHFAYT